MTSISPPSPVELLQALLRFDTTNPPGNEAGCIEYIRDLLSQAGIDSRLLARDPNRPNLLARLPGEGNAPPLLLYGHVDVVTTEGQRWTHPPFSGALADDYIWGRGALDMKGGVAMLVSAFLRAKTGGLTLPGDVLLCVVSDEEGPGDAGAGFLVEQHADLFDGVRYAISEFGGFSIHVAGRTFYPIQVAEKQICAVRATIRGPGGHGSQVMRGGTMAQLGRMLRRLERRRLPVHITPVARDMVETMAGHLPAPAGRLARQLLNPALTDTLLNVLGSTGRAFDPLLHNTVNATIVRGGSAINVIPSEVVVELDGRVLPGYSPEDLLGELAQVVGPGVELEITRFEPGPPAPDMGLFETLASVIREVDPAGIPVPTLLAGVTDARFFARLGIQSYGFLPMNLPKGFNFVETIHAADERIPADALTFGTDSLVLALQRF